MSFYTPATIKCNDEVFKVMLTKDDIQKRISELGEELDRDFEGKKPIFIGILNGAFIFLADLMRCVSIPCEVDFYKLSSYGDEKVSSGQVVQRKDIDANIEGRHIILVEDIVDTGLSVNYILNVIKQKNPASVSIVSLLCKPESIKYHVDVDYIGFEIPPKFVLGYGLDYGQEGRNLAQIYVLDEEASKKD
jgi:hypoxanthine phosphoribosyltransferase